MRTFHSGHFTDCGSEGVNCLKRKLSLEPGFQTRRAWGDRVCKLDVVKYSISDYFVLLLLLFLFCFFVLFLNQRLAWVCWLAVSTCIHPKYNPACFGLTYLRDLDGENRAAKDTKE